MFWIENDSLRVTIDAKGAELKSVFNKPVGLEYMWGADPAFWAKTSPVLFPIVGTLKNNTYQYQGQNYQLPRHGFARDKMFQVTEHSPSSITFSLQSDADSLAVYPFPFLFSILYTLTQEGLAVAYRVQNTGGETMLFSVGGHPAFRVPLVAGTAYDDYKLVFEKEETAGRWPISKEGLIEKSPVPRLQHTQELPLTRELFSRDAVVFKHLQSQWVQLASDKTPHGLRFSLAGFPYLGLWAAAGADFLCIEPWCGIADSVDTNQHLADKEGIVQLPPQGTFHRQWTVQFY